MILIFIYLFTAIGLSPHGSGYFTCKRNMKLVTTKSKPSAKFMHSSIRMEQKIRALTRRHKRRLHISLIYSLNLIRDSGIPPCATATKVSAVLMTTNPCLDLALTFGLAAPVAPPPRVGSTRNLLWQPYRRRSRVAPIGRGTATRTHRWRYVLHPAGLVCS